MRLLFLSYNGTSDPLLHTQGVAYLADFPRRGVTVHLLTYEKRVKASQARRTQTLQDQTEFTRLGIRWHRMRYHKWPPVLSTWFDVVCGWFYVWYLVMRCRITVLHARGTIPAAIAAPIAYLTGVPWLFDLRGVVTEEYVDGGMWRRGSWVHRWVGVVERGLIRQAKAMVVLTERAAEILTHNPTWRLRPGVVPQVIPCCVDVERFATLNSSTEPKELTGLAGCFTVVYVGSLGTWYLCEEMMAFFRRILAQRPEAQLLMVVSEGHQTTAHRLLRHMPGAQSHVTVVSSPPSAVPQHLRAAHVGLAFIKPAFSKQFSSPTKIGEYLASGIPVVVNQGVGDLDHFVRRHRVGVVLPAMEPASYQQGVEELFALLRDETLAARCRQAAREHLSLTVGRERYWQTYQAMLRNRGPALS